MILVRGKTVNCGVARLHDAREGLAPRAVRRVGRVGEHDVLGVVHVAVQLEQPPLRRARVVRQQVDRDARRLARRVGALGPPPPGC